MRKSMMLGTALGLALLDGQVIGGIGASFDTPEHDVQVAQAGLAALKH
jgi:uncharacterized protein GlcG (DUF336 family)